MDDPTHDAPALPISPVMESMATIEKVSWARDGSVKGSIDTSSKKMIDWEGRFDIG